MDPQHFGGSAGASRQQHANLRQQQEEFRRRLMRPDRDRDRDRVPRASPGGAAETAPNGGAGPAEPPEPLASFNGDGTRSSMQWTFQTPLGQFPRVSYSL
ncbi:hypothetical protein AAE478_006127 [Parahypoxylon ruwenzoriense]